MKRIIAILLCAILGIGLLAGCNTDESGYVPTGDGLGGETLPGQNLPVNSVKSFSLPYTKDASLNPFVCTDSVNRVLFSLIYQGLFVVNSNYEARPVLCDTYNISADMKTYTFHIATAYFSDGSRVTAPDVQASLQAAQTSPYYSGRLQHVSAVSAYGTTVVVELSTPMNDLPILLDIPVVKASEVDAEMPLGSGPYLLSNSHQELSLRRQAGWWCSAELPVSCDSIGLVAQSSSAGIRDAFEFGHINLSLTSPGQTDYVDYHSDYELWDCENGLFLFLVANAKSKIFNNPTILKALSKAIDRETLVKEYYHGFALPTALPVSPESPWYTEALVKDYRFDKSILQEAANALPEEDRAITLLLCNNDLMRVIVGNAIAEMLEACGFTVTVNAVPADQFVNQLRWGTYDLYLGQTKLSANMDLSAFFGPSTSMNHGGLSDPSLYALSLESLANSGNYYTLHKLVLEDGQLCPILFQQQAIYSHRGALDALSPSRDFLFYYDLGRSAADALINE